MNQMIQTLLNRRSCRSYKPDMIPEEWIAEIAKVGTYAPTSRGLQSPIILAVSNKELRDRLSVLNASYTDKPDSDPFYGAPVVFVVLADKNNGGAVYDGSCVMTNMLHAANALGLGSCWIHRAKQMFESEEGMKILKELGVEGEYIGIANCIVGYPAAGAAQAAPRKEHYVYFAK